MALVFLNQAAFFIGIDNDNYKYHYTNTISFVTDWK